MTIRVSNPVSNNDFVPISLEDQKIADQLLSSCVAEIKELQSPAGISLEAFGGHPALGTSNLTQFPFQLLSTLRVKDYKTGIAILESTPTQQAAVVLKAMETLVKARHNDICLDRLCHELLKMLLRRKLVYDNASIEQMLTLVSKEAIVVSSLPVVSILANVERHVEQYGMSNSIRNQLMKLLNACKPTSFLADERKIGLRITRLLENVAESAAGKSGCDPNNVLHPAVSVDSNSKGFEIKTGEAWTTAMLAELGKLSVNSRSNWHRLIEQGATAKSSKPTKKWRNATREIVEVIGQEEFVQVLSPTLAAIGHSGECQRFDHGGYVHFGEETQVHDTHADLLRGLVWATSCFEDERLIGLVGDAAEKCFEKIREIGPRSPKVGNACLLALSSLASEFAVAQLGRLKSRAKHVSTRKQISKAFQRAAEIAGMSEFDLEELGVPKSGLTEPGSYIESFGDFTANVTVPTNRSPVLVWVNANGKSQKTVPAAVKSGHAESLKALKKKLKDIAKLMPSVRQRIERLFLNERSWSLVDFRNRFLDHPIVGVVARRLIWTLNVNGEPTPACWHDGHFVDSSDQRLGEIDDQTVVTIWHPMHASPEQVLQWRRWLESHQICQPFKQAHREIYILTDAERATSVYSNRFGSHIIRQHQFAALCASRGWRYDLQGDWDSWNAPFIDLPQCGLRAEFFIQPLEGRSEVTQSFVYTHLATDQVRFLRLEIESENLCLPVPLSEVPNMVFSEVMRDVDLFVGVTSIGNDPELQERVAGNQHFDYWQSFSFGQLTETAVTRKQTLESVVPRLKIAKHCRIEGNFLVVTGKLRTYKIHMGSGNILMSPNDQYLCIVQKHGRGSKRTDSIYLPFEGDNTLALILSKAFMLVDDDKIKDQTIVNQIRLDR